MSFSADWLTLRAAADDAARNPGLVAKLAAWAGERAAAQGAELTVVDIGAGTGATLAALHGRLPRARWRLVDNDAELLEVATARAAAMGARVETATLDLAADPGAALRGAWSKGAPRLATASAFFDLVGAGWLRRFAAEAAAEGAAVYAALTYDGFERWSPPHPEDEAVGAAFLADMRRDKGMGPALGADAGPALAKALRAEGFTVETAPSPWRLKAPEDAALIGALAAGVASAAGASPEWRAARVSARAVEVGHLDVLALPPA